MATWFIWLPDRLGAVLDERIEAAGSLRKAARGAGVSEANLRRIAKARSSYHISEATATKLLEWLPEHHRAELEVFSPAPYVGEASNEDATRLRHELGIGSKFASAAFGGSVRTVRARAREEMYDRLVAQPELRALFEWFHASLNKRGVSVTGMALSNMGLRAQLSYERVLGPLVYGEGAGGVESTWEELARTKTRRTPTGAGRPKRGGGRGRPSRLYRFLKLGMDRELVLLDHGAPSDRIVSRIAPEKAKKIRQKALEEMLLEIGEGRPTGSRFRRPSEEA